ncbi:MAG: phosphotransferase family protein [Lactobacillales bacterium]|jgi:thiamine kinase-like enzyme|nr:phosphotransferase family protein [Lactobacillales bacterium]
MKKFKDVPLFSGLDENELPDINIEALTKKKRREFALDNNPEVDLNQTQVIDLNETQTISLVALTQDNSSTLDNFEIPKKKKKSKEVRVREASDDVKEINTDDIDSIIKTRLARHENSPSKAKAPVPKPAPKIEAKPTEVEIEKAQSHLQSYLESERNRRRSSKETIRRRTLGENLTFAQTQEVDQPKPTFASDFKADITKSTFIKSHEMFDGGKDELFKRSKRADIEGQLEELANRANEKDARKPLVRENRLKKLLNKESKEDLWEFAPIKGNTNRAFLAVKADERAFVKKNTTPLIASLAAEGLTPTLLRIQKTPNGDFLAFQEWVEGHLLTADEVVSDRDVKDVLFKLHNSSYLAHMLERLDGDLVDPFDLFQEYDELITDYTRNQRYMGSVYNYLAAYMPEPPITPSVVHGDVVHNNWLATSNYMYLVDWDSVKLGDPYIDLSIILGRYVPFNQWATWLSFYGEQATRAKLEKMRWYAIMQIALNMARLESMGANDHLINREILLLKKLHKY